jgi:antitoxin HicB
MDQAANPGGRQLDGLVSLDDWLENEGFRDEVELRAIKRVLLTQLSETIRELGLSKGELARRMSTSGAEIERALSEGADISIATLARAARAVGRRVRIEIE